ncbi:MAG TPA: flagellar hook-basal body complex protein FliE [Actinomycetales bacterium]|nr:flagellar hook-basal body complex protein FliE [Actinomycetales bacterium]
MSGISPVGGFVPFSIPTTVSPVVGAGAPDVTGVEQAAGGGFATALGQGLQSLQQTQTHADELAVQAATGDLTDVHDFMIASTQAQLATELTVTLRNKALDAFNEIMRMQG